MLSFNVVLTSLLCFGTVVAFEAFFALRRSRVLDHNAGGHWLFLTVGAMWGIILSPISGWEAAAAGSVMLFACFLWAALAAKIYREELRAEREADELGDESPTEIFLRREPGEFDQFSRDGMTVVPYESVEKKS